MVLGAPDLGDCRLPASFKAAVLTATDRPEPYFSRISIISLGPSRRYRSNTSLIGRLFGSVTFLAASPRQLADLAADKPLPSFPSSLFLISSPHLSGQPVMAASGRERNVKKKIGLPPMSQCCRSVAKRAAGVPAAGRSRHGSRRAKRHCLATPLAAVELSSLDGSLGAGQGERTGRSGEDDGFISGG